MLIIIQMVNISEHNKYTSCYQNMHFCLYFQRKR